MTAPLTSERVRCCGCSAEISLAILQIAPATHGWTELEGFRFCADCTPAAKHIVALDRERNAHQVTLLALDKARDATRLCARLATSAQTVGIGPDDTAVIVDALDLWDRYLTAPHADIKRIRAALTGPTPKEDN